MRLTGVTDKLQGKLFTELGIDDTTSKSQVQHKAQTGLGYEDVLFPFMALLTGIFMALLQLGLETAVKCKKKYSDDGDQYEEDESRSQKAEDIIDDIHVLLMANHNELGGIKFLDKIRMLSSLQDGTLQ